MLSPSPRLRRRKALNAVMMLLATASAALGLIVLALILGDLCWQGLSALNAHVLSQDTPGPMSEGGLRNAIVGSFLLSGLAVLIGTPIGLFAGTYLSEYGRYSKLAQVLRFLNDILLSVPSIIVGLFVYQVLVRPVGHFSGLAGAVALAILVVPTVVRTTENMLRLVPDQLREAALAMGAPRWHMIRRVIWKAALSGIVTGVLLAIARISGETAPLLFTALSNSFFSLDMTRPMASLPITIYQFALSPYENWQALAWAGAFLITLTVLAISVLARAVTAKGDRA
ncbi:phosphate ABC transporter permease PstA [Pseudooceanicola sp. CBS1P-1]|uniref:Phosphate transport system permease protein PstA n=1 Tax=Pseudooceanicola albus TaxID=2692189 RepID=A0A6L7G571_9RHOB|nr:MULTISPECIES: phosphate ABC transporter permease PstA [Pseudooceanicola]MBT9382973.1 phosphate ABC transporter permease PstA [Pseudooceanicola endophyticus]MXN19161.1 phosphate ABC transporter permease PstA [Pseudooceanicola albus]